MKKRTIVALIVAAVLIFAGGLLLVLGLSYAGSSNDLEPGLVSQEAILPETFDGVKIDTKDCNVKFVAYNADVDARVTVTGEPESVSHSIRVEDGILNIEMIDHRKWTDYIGVFHIFDRTEMMEITVYLPAAEYDSLQVRTDTGDIALPQVPCFLEVQLRSDTGDINCVGVSTDVLNCMTSTGEISVQNSVPNVMKLQSGTGDLQLSVIAADEIHLKTNTGEVEVRKVDAQMFTCSSETGKVELKQVIATDYLQVKTDTGNVQIDESDADQVNIETGTGNVTGHFLTPKYFNAHSDTGNVKVPEGREGGECLIQTDTGNIHFQ